jgi:hypothetical protein
MQSLCDPGANSIEHIHSFMRGVVCWDHIFVGMAINNLAYCDKTFGMYAGLLTEANIIFLWKYTRAFL